MKIAVDFDGTISADPQRFRELLAKLIDKGDEVVIWSQRAARSEPGRSRDMDEMVRLLQQWKVPYTEICQRGKMWADLYIDDKAVRYDRENPLSFYRIEDRIEELEEEESGKE